MYDRLDILRERARGELDRVQREETTGEQFYIGRIGLFDDDYESLLDPTRSKGLEFDAVLIADPAQIVADSPQGLSDLYVATTRATKHLTIIGDLPEVLTQVHEFVGVVEEVGRDVTTVRKGDFVTAVRADGRRLDR
jgi:DNA helicase IV